MNVAATTSGIPCPRFFDFFEHYITTPQSGITLCDILHLSEKMDPFFCQDHGRTRSEFWGRFYTQVGRAISSGALKALEQPVGFLLPSRKFVGPSAMRMELVVVKLTNPLITDTMLHFYKVHKFDPGAYLSKHGQIGEELFRIPLLVHWDGTPQHEGFIVGVPLR